MRVRDVLLVLIIAVVASAGACGSDEGAGRPVDPTDETEEAPDDGDGDTAERVGDDPDTDTDAEADVDVDSADPGQESEAESPPEAPVEEPIAIDLTAQEGADFIAGQVEVTPSDGVIDVGVPALWAGDDGGQGTTSLVIVDADGSEHYTFFTYSDPPPTEAQCERFSVTEVTQCEPRSMVWSADGSVVIGGIAVERTGDGRLGLTSLVDPDRLAAIETMFLQQNVSRDGQLVTRIGLIDPEPIVDTL